MSTEIFIPDIAAYNADKSPEEIWDDAVAVTKVADEFAYRDDEKTG